MSEHGWIAAGVGQTEKPQFRGGRFSGNFRHGLEHFEAWFFPLLIDNRPHNRMATDHQVQGLIKEVGTKVAVPGSIDMDGAAQFAGFVLDKAFAVAIQGFLEVHEREIGHLRIRMGITKDFGPQVVGHLADRGQAQEILSDFYIGKDLTDGVKQGKGLGHVPNKRQKFQADTDRLGLETQAWMPRPSGVAPQFRSAAAQC